MRKAYLFFITFLMAVFGMACRHHAPRPVDRAFYHWQSVFSISPFEQQVLDTLHISRLYIKYFDVDWNAAQHAPQPVAHLQVSDKQYFGQHDYKIVPTVFITNPCIQQLTDEQVPALAANIIRLITQIDSSYNITKIPEWQIDCDWTASTRDKYFMLLQKIKVHTAQKHIKLSATIRLYQCKYQNKTGIPPVDKGLLMCYNMGNLKSPDTKNSILETGELKKYAGAMDAYPLPLDIGLPLFGWKVLFRKNKYAGLIQQLPDDSLRNNALIMQHENRYTFQADTDIAGYHFVKGDVLRNEDSDINEILATTTYLGEKLPVHGLSVSLYHLDSVTLAKYNMHELESIFAGLH